MVPAGEHRLSIRWDVGRKYEDTIDIPAFKPGSEEFVVLITPPD
jgi:hypothetical protein